MWDTDKISTSGVFVHIRQKGHSILKKKVQTLPSKQIVRTSVTCKEDFYDKIVDLTWSKRATKGLDKSSYFPSPLDTAKWSSNVLAWICISTDPLAKTSVTKKCHFGEECLLHGRNMQRWYALHMFIIIIEITNHLVLSPEIAFSQLSSLGESPIGDEIKLKP